MVSASYVNLSDTILNSTGLGLQINFSSEPRFATQILVNNSNPGFIYFKELRTSESSLNRLTFNMTQAGDYLGTDLPYFSSSLATSQVITSNIYSINSSVNMTAVCGFNSFEYTSALGTQSNPSHECNSNAVTTLVQLDQGVNRFDILTQNIDATSSNLIRNGLSVLLAVALIIIAGMPLFNENWRYWAVQDWIRYFILLLIAIVFITIALNVAFNTTYAGA